MKKLATLIVIVAASVTACAANDDYGYRNQGGTYIEQRSYGSSIGGTTWYREEVPYYPNTPNYDRNRNGVPDYKERDRDGIPDYKDRRPGNFYSR